MADARSTPDNPSVSKITGKWQKSNRTPEFSQRATEEDMPSFVQRAIACVSLTVSGLCAFFGGMWLCQRAAEYFAWPDPLKAVVTLIGSFSVFAMTVLMPQLPGFRFVRRNLPP